MCVCVFVFMQEKVCMCVLDVGEVVVEFAQVVEVFVVPVVQGGEDAAAG